jgi:hypothetical protein
VTERDFPRVHLDFLVLVIVSVGHWSRWMWFPEHDLVMSYVFDNDIEYNGTTAEVLDPHLHNGGRTRLPGEIRDGRTPRKRNREHGSGGQ